MSQKMRIHTEGAEFIDQTKPLMFSFAGKHYHGFVGDTLASALLANGVHLLSRSFKYHRPRGPLTMAGNDANTLVQQLGDHTSSTSYPNVLADVVEVADGECYDAQNYAGSLERDWGRFTEKLSRFLPVGFYYKTFYRPVLGFLDKNKKDSWPLWEPLIRQSAGLGKLDLDAKEPLTDKQYLHCDVAIVGAGPAGLSAALFCAEHHLRVLLIEAERQLGGSLLYGAKTRLLDHNTDNNTDSSNGSNTGNNTQAQQLISQVQNHKHIKTMTKACCTGVYEDHFLGVVTEKRFYKVRAKACILATGQLEQHIVFRNNDLPGIMLCSAANRLIKLYGVKPGSRAVIACATDEGYNTALMLANAGIDVCALVDLRTQPDNAELALEIKEKHIPLIVNSTVYEANSEKKRHHLGSVEVRKIVARGEVAEQAQLFECDVLCVSAGYMPAYHLACQAGAKLEFDDETETFSLQGLPEGLLLAGGINGFSSIADTMADAKYQGAILCSGLDSTGLDITSTVQPKKIVPTASGEIAWPIFKHPRGKEFVDFDEDLHLRDIENATRLGYRDIQLVKRFSTVGMGPSQGKHSALATARIVARATGRTVGQTGVTTARPPLVGEKLSLLAGQCFSPYKRGVLHDCHVKLGAQFMPAGLWQRPAYYGPVAERDEHILSEATHLRKAVGIIDVSTLGGLDIRGPDAAEFLMRFYTFGFLQQKLGTTRYAIATNEAGVVIDDGVACRVAEDYFYVTATTSGVDALYRSMTKWNAQWRLDVDIANVTSAYAAVNVAGPEARKLLADLPIDIDLSADAFPYLAYREGRFAGIPIRMLRVGFVGELGYEIHVPSAYGEAIWNMIFEHGKSFGLKPVGVEAQRLLRLEKGHIIVGQDSDGMSHPAELGLSWAVNTKKPFFVGCKSVDIYKDRPLKRKLVGFSIAKTANPPKEGHLVFANEEDANTFGSVVQGNITSSAYSATLEKYIGLAFVGIEQADDGSWFAIRVDNNEVVQAQVCRLPFYDPDNLRNKE